LKLGLSPDFVHRVHGSRSDANAPDKLNVWLTPARSGLNRPQICKFSYFFQRVAANKIALKTDYHKNETVNKNKVGNYNKTETKKPDGNRNDNETEI